VLLILIGLGALTIGAELVVRSGSRLARRIGVPPILVGLTIVSLGTSFPELAIGIDAVRSGAPPRPRDDGAQDARPDPRKPGKGRSPGRSAG